MVKKEVWRRLCWQEVIFIKAQGYDPWVESVACWGRDGRLTLYDGVGGGQAKGSFCNNVAVGQRTHRIQEALLLSNEGGFSF